MSLYSVIKIFDVKNFQSTDLDRRVKAIVFLDLYYILAKSVPVLRIFDTVDQ